MELGQYQLQIFVGLAMILGAAFVALICDFLKGNNEQLRELTIELKVRREEEQKRSQTMTANPREPLAVPGRSKASIGVVEVAVEKPSPEKLVEKTLDAAREPRRPAHTPERKRAIAPEALAAMARGAQMASAPRRPVPVSNPAAHELRKPEAAEHTAPPATDGPAPVSANPVREQAVRAGSIGIGFVSEEWANTTRASRRRSLQARNSAHPDGDVLCDAVRAAPAASTASEVSSFRLPAGFHERLMLSHLIQGHQPVSGLVVSIGVSTCSKGETAVPEPVRKLVQSLIGPDDFACQSGDDEFLLIYPHRRGASAQHQLRALAQQLWDFQLRSLGSFSVFFSWGAVEASSESIDEAIASASERMQETKRGRKAVEMQSPRRAALRQAS